MKVIIYYTTRKKKKKKKKKKYIYIYILGILIFQINLIATIAFFTVN